MMMIRLGKIRFMGECFVPVPSLLEVGKIHTKLERNMSETMYFVKFNEMMSKLLRVKTMR